MDELTALTARAARRLIGARQLSPVELLDACLAQIERVDPAVNAMVTVAAEGARVEAAAATDAVARGEALGPLHGLPVAIKDIQATAGIRTTYGSERYANHVPTDDGDMAAAVRAAGGIVVGKTNVPEFSIGANTVNRLFGATGNPFAPDRTCGGSSGGSAVVLATNQVPLATGSDHGGSLRIPACYCGVVGHRATPGVVPFDTRTTAQTFYSVQGPMARTVDDAALLLSVLAARTPRSRRDPMAFPLDATTFATLDEVDLAGLRVAVSADLGGLLVSQSIRRTFVDRVERLARLVAACDEHPIDLRDAPGVDWRLRQDVFVTQYLREAGEWDEGFNPNIRRTYDSALATPMADIAAGRRRQVELYRDVAAVFDTYDVLICPGVSIPPFPWRFLNPPDIDGQPVENYMAWLGLTAAITVVGHPVTALPCGLDEAGTPFGIQVIGSAYADHRVLSVARALEAAFAADPVTARPVPDLERLAAMPFDGATAGKTVQLDA